MSKAVEIDFFADVSCPWCYVGWSALKLAASERREKLSASITWRSFLLAPDLPAEGMDRTAYLGARYAKAQIDAAHEALRGAAEAAGVPIAIEKSTRVPSTINAHRLVHWAAGEGVAGPVIDALFHAYFVDGLDIGATDVLCAIAEQAGMDPHETRARLASDLDRDTVLGLHAGAQKLGLRGVPAAVFNRKSAVMGGQAPAVYGQALDSLG